MPKIIPKTRPTAHQFHSKDAPHPLAVKSAKASVNGQMLIPHRRVLGYDMNVWGVNTNFGPLEITDGDWILEDPIFGVVVLDDSKFNASFLIQEYSDV